jgi:uncharacterized protein (TIRG00374 family)
MVIVLIIQVIATTRWMLLLADVPFVHLFRLTLIGQFFALVMPSALAGDIARVLTRRSGEGTAVSAAGSVLVDKLVGLFAIQLLLVGSLMFGNLSVLPGLYQTLLIVTFLTGITLSIIVVPSMNSILQGLLLRFASGLSQAGWAQRITLWILRVVEVVHYSYARILASLLLAVLFQTMILVGYLLLTVAFDLRLTLNQCLFISGITQLSMLVPFGAGGVGLKEVTFVSIARIFGTDTSVAVAASLAGYPVTLFYMLVGWMLFQSNNTHQKKQQ